MYKEKRRCNWWLIIIMVVFILVQGTPARGETGVVIPQNREMKLLVKTDIFFDRDQGYQEYWAIIKKLAVEMNVGISESDYAFAESEKRIIYYDTENMILAKNNYILRQRVNVLQGITANKCDITLKYRVNGGEDVPYDAVVTTSSYKPAISFQEDYMGFYGGVLGHNHGEMSLSHTLKKISSFEPKILGDFAQYFPSLGNLETSLAEPLYSINGISIREYKVSPGILHFGGTNGEVSISLWLNYDTGKPMIAEISWECDKAPADEVAKAERFFNALQERSQDLLYPGQTKGEFIFAGNK